jgi:hypothetical protein
MARFDFQSPGAGFTDQITDMLAQRKAEERQRMLDQLTVNADRRAQEVAARQQSEHEEQMRGMGQEREIGLVNALGVGRSRGDDLSTLSPEQRELFSKYGRTTQFPGTQVSTTTEMEGVDGLQTEVAPPTPPRMGYVGTPQEMEDERRRAADASAIARMMESDNPAEREKGALLSRMMSMNDGKIPAEFAAKLMTPGGRVRSYNPDTGKMSDLGEVGAFDQVISQGYRPRDFSQQPLMPLESEDGSQAGYWDPNQRKLVEPPPGWRHRRPGGSQYLPLGVSDGASSDYRQQLEIINPDPETGLIAPGVMSSLRQTAGVMIANSRTSPKVKDIAMRFLNDPSSIASEQMTDTEKTQFKQLMTLIAPDAAVVDVYRRNAIRQPKSQDKPAPAPTRGPTQRFSPSNLQIGSPSSRFMSTQPAPSAELSRLFADFNKPYKPTQY